MFPGQAAGPHAHGPHGPLLMGLSGFGVQDLGLFVRGGGVV